MKRLLVFLVLVILIVGTLNSDYIYANSMENSFIAIRLTSPIKSNSYVNLYGEEGFLIYNKGDLLGYLDYFEEENVRVAVLEKDIIGIFDMEGNLLFSYNQEEELILTSGKSNERKVRVEDNFYRDFIQFKIIDGNLIVINYIDLENYLYGVVPREMPASFEMEALKAQAIASRTYALKNRSKHIAHGYDLCDNTHCQVYGGMDGEQENTNRAVDMTRGMIITYAGNIIDALYHSNSGGITEASSEAWGYNHPYLTSVDDKYSIDAPNGSWSYKMTTNEINRKLKDYGINVGNILDIKITETSSSGRVTKLKIVGTSGERTLSKGEIREVLGLNEIKSNLFTIKKGSYEEVNSNVYAIDSKSSTPQLVDLNNVKVIDSSFERRSSRGITSRFINRDGIVGNDSSVSQQVNSFIIEGKGYGHGVGMSQWGAKKMAELGYSYEDILKHYYSGIDITINNR
ncbi:SpoIID/LytB domain-containing protein [Tepidimicrobium xylanilyticum]|uniref:SpoIID/LytB domain-containing protein n=1 Tax=Tepidimicrobium xylanilyticum TaxID=1123352 RepID=UPI00264D5CAA|nr:SpoIID/LytB domain-containing protein [Tepidimicrobium xylanilyticum]GMG97818.1 SpoIID protein [Tepidimicrobium xylanilyticum]